MFFTALSLNDVTALSALGQEEGAVRQLVKSRPKNLTACKGMNSICSHLCELFIVLQHYVSVCVRKEMRCCTKLSLQAWCLNGLKPYKEVLMRNRGLQHLCALVLPHWRHAVVAWCKKKKIWTWNPPAGALGKTYASVNIETELATLFEGIPPFSFL